jgi:uncharacterized protein YdhG (YjbR/CyaY superfamily)
MQIFVDTIEEYIAQIPEERREGFRKLLEIVDANLPKGFQQNMQYGMVTWCVPLETYPAGYHCAKNTPLPFLSVASQKNFVAFYNMGIYAEPEILDWFVEKFPKHSKKKLDMGKSCIRFKKIEDITYDLLGELCQKITVNEWIAIYEKNYKN